MSLTLKSRAEGFGKIKQKNLKDFPLKIVLALEFFIASDLIKAVLEPTLDRVIILAFIVGIRTVVGYSLNQELKELPPGSE